MQYFDWFQVKLALIFSWGFALLGKFWLINIGFVATVPLALSSIASLFVIYKSFLEIKSRRKKTHLHNKNKPK